MFAWIVSMLASISFLVIKVPFTSTVKFFNAVSLWSSKAVFVSSIWLSADCWVILDIADAAPAISPEASADARLILDCSWLASLEFDEDTLSSADALLSYTVFTSSSFLESSSKAFCLTSICFSSKSICLCCNWISLEICLILLLNPSASLSISISWSLNLSISMSFNLFSLSSSLLLPLPFGLSTTGFCCPKFCLAVVKTELVAAISSLVCASEPALWLITACS